MNNIQEIWQNLQRQRQLSNLLFQQIQSFLQQGYELNEIKNRLIQEYPNDKEIVQTLINMFQKGLDCHANGHKLERMRNGSKQCKHCGILQP
ncbi:hypothetical protein [Bacillus toyonensis]|uniref:hypothetical protein n=1 Tax=Bacillus toyonensis TaxID=155322 RepID=UPI000BF945F2|nr:hypothetical protein [Bacillus toyonensis]PGF05005.1 hypothetical protein COM61_00790 [Bacillus toyonensis]